jgi:acyl-CoA thioesterase-1
LAWALLLVLAASGAPAGLARERPVLLVVGDSLSAAYGIESARGWVALLEARLQARGYPHQVVNASISGDTTRGGRSRLPAALERHAPALVVLALGGNDGLRGLPLAETERNLAAMIEASRARGARLLLVGIRLPPNYGPAYSEAFRAIYPRLAERYGLPLVPFLLEGVGGDAQLMQADGLHPRAEAQTRILENVWRELAPLLAPEAAARSVPATVGAGGGGP